MWIREQVLKKLLSYLNSGHCNTQEYAIDRKRSKLRVLWKTMLLFWWKEMSTESGLYRGRDLKLIKEKERWGHLKNLGIWRLIHWMLVSMFGNNGGKSIEMRLYYCFIMFASDLSIGRLNNGGWFFIDAIIFFWF